MADSSGIRAKQKTIGSIGIRIALSAALSLAAAGWAAAQYPGGGGTGSTGGTGGTYTGPSGGYGSGKAIGIGVGAAAGAGLLFLALHHSSMTGCVQPAEDGLRLVDEKKNVSYALVAGDIYLKPGQRVALRGQKSKSTAGLQTFAPKKLVKDLGACGSDAPARTPPSDQHGPEHN